MKNKIKNICIIIASAGLLSSCVNDTFNTPIQDTCVSPGLTKTKTIADIYAIAKNPVATPKTPAEMGAISNQSSGAFRPKAARTGAEWITM